jgi:ADP-heptose:LPS heptosyltransferase
MSSTAGLRPHRTLVVRLSAVGDVVHTLPAVAALAEAGHAIHWAVQPRSRPLVERNPAVAAVVEIPATGASPFGALRRARRELVAARTPLAFDFQGLWKSAGWALLSRAARRIGFDRAHRREPGSAILLTELRAPPQSARHVIDKNLALLEALGIRRIGARDFPLPPFEREQAWIARALVELGLLGAERPVLLHPGGGWSSKLWPAERYGELAARLAARGLPAVVSWGPGEEALARTVVDASGGVARAAPPATLLELAALARASRAVVAADTGPLHLACALGTPAVALFGPTDPARNGPWSADDLVVARRPPCFPCHRRDCPAHAGVLAGIPVAEVERAIVDRLEREGGEATLFAEPSATRRPSASPSR